MALRTYELKELPSRLASLVSAARAAHHSAYAPYSNFRVGAAIMDDTDTIYTGSNQENASYPLCMCAERVALYHYIASKNAKAITALAVYAVSKENRPSEPPSPCGACRQVIAEFQTRQSQPFKILVSNQFDQVWMFDSIQDLLPYGFDRKHLL